MVGDVLNLARVIDCTLAEGPGIRMCVWTQGCLKNCPGCCNAQMRPLTPCGMTETEDLIARVREAWSRPERPEGITFLGGEPFLQAAGLTRVAAEVRRLGGTVMVFSGYTLEELRRNAFPGTEDLLALTDVLVDGPYLADRPESRRNWIGSTNQRFHYFTSAYDTAIETAPEYRHVVELRPGKGVLTVNGCPRTLQGI